MQTLRVRRLYDSKNSTLLYVAYSTRIDGSQNVSLAGLRLMLCLFYCTTCYRDACSSSVHAGLASTQLMPQMLHTAGNWQQVQDINMRTASVTSCSSSCHCSICSDAQGDAVITVMTQTLIFILMSMCSLKSLCCLDSWICKLPSKCTVTRQRFHVGLTYYIELWASMLAETYVGFAVLFVQVQLYPF